MTNIFVRPDDHFDEAPERPQRDHVDGDVHEPAVQKGTGEDAPPLAVLQNGRRIERTILHHAIDVAAARRRKHPRAADEDFPHVADQVQRDQRTGNLHAGSATITIRASSSEIAWRPFSFSTVIGPPSGAFSITRTFAPGRNPTSSEIAQDLRNLFGDADDRGLAAGLDLRERHADALRIAQIVRRNRMPVRTGLRIVRAAS